MHLNYFPNIEGIDYLFSICQEIEAYTAPEMSFYELKTITKFPDILKAVYKSSHPKEGLEKAISFTFASTQNCSFLTCQYIEFILDIKSGFARTKYLKYRHIVIEVESYQFITCSSMNGNKIQFLAYAKPFDNSIWIFLTASLFLLTGNIKNFHVKLFF